MSENLPSLPIRNSAGLYDHIQYKFTKEGFVDWKEMIPKTKDYFAINKDRTKETDITKVDEKDLLILLNGIRKISFLRGYSKVVYDNLVSSPEHCTITCQITWLPNFETNNKEIITSGCGDASYKNTRDFARYYLGPISENRAFVRCVRNFLGINIVGYDEIGTISVDEMTSIPLNSPKIILEELMASKNISLDNIKKKLINENFPDADKIIKLEDIPVSKMLNLIERIKKSKSS